MLTPQSLDIEALNHVARPTTRLEASRRFWIEVMGFKEISRPDFSFRGAWLYRAGMQIHLIETMSELNVPPQIDTRARHMAFTVDDVDATEELLKAHGIPYKRNLIPDYGIHQIFFHDPDGHVIEVGKYGLIDR